MEEPVVDEKKESKQKEVKSLCANDRDLHLEPITIGQETYTVRMDDDKKIYYCFTQEEIDNILNYDVPETYEDISINAHIDENNEENRKNFPFIIQPPKTQLIAHSIAKKGRLLADQDKNLKDDLIEIFKRQTDKKYWLYFIPYLGVYVNHTFADLVDRGHRACASVMHVKLKLRYPPEYDMLNYVTIMKSVSTTVGGVHDYKVKLYIAEKDDFDVYNIEELKKSNCNDILDYLDAYFENEIYDIELYKLYTDCLYETENYEYALEMIYVAFVVLQDFSSAYLFLRYLNKPNIPPNNRYSSILLDEIYTLIIKINSKEDLKEYYDFLLSAENIIDKYMDTYVDVSMYLCLYCAYTILKQNNIIYNNDLNRIKDKILKLYYENNNVVDEEKKKELKEIKNDIQNNINSFYDINRVIKKYFKQLENIDTIESGLLIIQLYVLFYIRTLEKEMQNYNDNNEYNISEIHNTVFEKFEYVLKHFKKLK